jgi:hypothetical protein
MLTKSLRDTVLDIIKIRATNYRLTDDEFSTLYNMVYSEISNTVPLVTVTVHVTISKAENPVEILPPSADYTITGVYEAIERKTGDDITNYFIFSEPLRPRLRDDCYYLERCAFFDRYGATVDVDFNCTATTYDYNLPARIQDRLVPVMVEGILYSTRDYIPSQVDMADANAGIQRYYTEKKQLMADFPLYRR